jgi:hypothetical protein
MLQRPETVNSRKKRGRKKIYYPKNKANNPKSFRQSIPGVSRTLKPLQCTAWLHYDRVPVNVFLLKRKSIRELHRGLGLFKVHCYVSSTGVPVTSNSKLE